MGKKNLIQNVQEKWPISNFEKTFESWCTIR